MRVNWIKEKPSIQPPVSFSFWKRHSVLFPRVFSTRGYTKNVYYNITNQNCALCNGGISFASMESLSIFFSTVFLWHQGLEQERVLGIIRGTVNRWQVREFVVRSMLGHVRTILGRELVDRSNQLGWAKRLCDVLILVDQRVCSRVKVRRRFHLIPTPPLIR